MKIFLDFHSDFSKISCSESNTFLIDTLRVEIGLKSIQNLSKIT